MLPKKKIIFVSHEFPPFGGGASTALDKISQQLSNHQYDISIITIGGESSINHTDSFGRHIKYVGTFRKNKMCPAFIEMLKTCLCMFFRLRKNILSSNPDIIISFFSFPAGFFVKLTSPKKSIPHFVFLRGGDTPGFKEEMYTIYSFLIKPFIRYTLQSCTVILANGCNLISLLKEQMPQLKAINIHNGVDRQDFSTTGFDTINIIFVGQLIKRKNIETTLKIIIDAAKNTKEKIVFNIVGEGTEKSNLLNLCQSAPDNLSIQFKGYVEREELKQLYKHQHIMFHLSENEGLSNTFLEGLSHGLLLFTTPTVASDIIIEHSNFPGIIFDQIDHEIIKNKLLGVIKNKQDLPDIRKRTYEYSQCITWASCANKLNNLIKQFI